MKAYANGNFIQSALFVFLLNFPMHIAMFLLGYIKIGVLISIIQSFLMGTLVGMGDDKTDEEDRTSNYKQIS